MSNSSSPPNPSIAAPAASPDTDGSARRAQTLEELLVEALTARGHVTGQRDSGFRFCTIGGWDIDFRCEERSRYAGKSSAWKRRHHRAAIGEGQVSASGRRMTVLVRPSSHLCTRRWRESHPPLEKRVDEFVSKFEAIARGMEEAERERQERERQHDAKMRRAAAWLLRQHEIEARPDELETLARNWQKAQRLRTFLTAVEKRLTDHPEPEGVALWLEWAREHVEEIDPLSDAALEDLPALDDEPEDYDKEAEWDDEVEEYYHMGWLDEYMEDDAA